MLWPSLEFILGVSMIITLLAGGHLVLEHRITVGQFVSFNAYMLQLTWPIIALGYVINLFQRGTASLGRLNEILQEQPQIADSAMARDRDLQGEIEFRGLKFSYDGKPVLHDVNLLIPAGSSLAIVGPTGSGKTTLVDLIPRIYDAEPGSVLIDGLPIRRFPIDALRSNIGFVPQETFLFSDTIRENISFGKDNATAAEVRAAADAANIATDIESFPDGFDTVVGERGITLSGGQKQRTAIARALRDFRELTVITNAVNIAAELAGTTIDVILTGGTLRKNSFSLVGPQAEDTLREINADILFLGVDGFDTKVGLTTQNVLEARVNRSMAHAARKVVAVCDSSKFGRRSLAVIVQPNGIHEVITDKNVPRATVQELREAGIEVTLV